jgi:hypothetical protein
VKGVGNILNKKIAENFPNIDKEMSILVQEAFSTPNRHDQNRTYPQTVIVRTISTGNKERILKTIKEKGKKNI